MSCFSLMAYCCTVLWILDLIGRFVRCVTRSVFRIYFYCCKMFCCIWCCVKKETRLKIKERNLKRKEKRKEKKKKKRARQSDAENNQAVPGEADEERLAAAEETRAASKPTTVTSRLSRRMSVGAALVGDGLSALQAAGRQRARPCPTCRSQCQAGRHRRSAGILSATTRQPAALPRCRRSPRLRP